MTGVPTSVDDMDDLHIIPSSEDPAEAPAAMVSFRRLPDRLELASIQCAIDQRRSRTQVAQSLGVTREAARKRHARRIRTRPDRKDDA